jgi:hypothetical protein
MLNKAMQSGPSLRELLITSAKGSFNFLWVVFFGTCFSIKFNVQVPWRSFFTLDNALFLNSDMLSKITKQNISLTS